MTENSYTEFRVNWGKLNNEPAQYQLDVIEMMKKGYTIINRPVDRTHYVSPQEYERMILALRLKTDWSISKNKIEWNQDKQRFEPI